MNHDLHTYMSQLGLWLESEYTRIRKSAKADPGTAGDEGEENWAQLLREWLPPTYRVVTKGQLLSADGGLSPQVDVIVLKPSYPLSLENRKKYLLGGVAAAFECKLTLRRSHVPATVKRIAAIKRMESAQIGSPYRELMSQPICGLLAHSSELGAARAKPARMEAVSAAIVEADTIHVRHPREMTDLVCIADLASWGTSKEPLSDPKEELHPATRKARDPKGTPSTAYMCHGGQAGVFAEEDPQFGPLGIFLTELLVKLAWEDATLRPIASYFIGVEFSKASSGMSRHWPRSIYSLDLKRKLRLSRLAQELGWDEWAFSIE
jgi:hypothetical protein